jgi:HlyD family secretion protein
MSRQLQTTSAVVADLVRRSRLFATTVWQPVAAPPIDSTRLEFEPRLSLRGPGWAGLAAIGFGFGGFLLWSMTAYIDSAAIASGTVIVDSKKKTISHLEGGILKRLLVNEGDKVKTGQPLVEMDDTRAAADLAAGNGQRLGLLAKLARLRAERDQAAAVDFPPSLISDTSAIAASVIADEQHLFAMRREIYAGKIEVAQKQIEQSTSAIDAAGAQAEAAAEQRDILQKQLNNIQTLVTKGAATERQASDLQGRLSQAIGDAGQFAAEKAKAEQEKAAAQVALLSVTMEWQGDIASDIQDTQLKLNDTEQRIAAAQDVLSRLTVRAPQDGTVLDIQKRTPGSAIGGGEAILDIEPDDEPLVVEARLNPIDIASVRSGAPAQIRLTGYNMRTHPPLDGSVTYVAPDQTQDAQRGTAYYTIRAAIDPAELASHPAMKMYPGMPAELVVTHEARRAIDYLLDPLTRTFYRAFRED